MDINQSRLLIKIHTYIAEEKIPTCNKVSKTHSGERDHAVIHSFPVTPLLLQCKQPSRRQHEQAETNGEQHARPHHRTHFWREDAFKFKLIYICNNVIHER